MNGLVKISRVALCVLVSCMPIMVRADYWVFEVPYHPDRTVIAPTAEQVAADFCRYADSYQVYEHPCCHNPEYKMEAICYTNGSQYAFSIDHICDDNTHWAGDNQCQNDPKPVDPNRGKQCPMVGDPINISTGNMYRKEVDYRGRGQFPLEIVRYYNSQSSASLITHFGRGWRHNYDAEIVEDSVGLAVTKRPSGRTDEWSLNNGGYNSQTMSRSKLDRTASGWTLSTGNGYIETYDNDGRLASIRNPNGLIQTLLYSQDGLLQSVTDPNGRSIQFTYDQFDRLIEIAVPNGDAYTYTYDRYWRLTGVSFPDDTPADKSDNPNRQYHYEDNRIFALTGITDENGVRQVTWSYDESGRAIQSEHAGGVDRFALTFNDDGSRTVTNPLGKQTTYYFQDFNGLQKVSQVEGYPSTNCASSSKAYTYFPDGTLKSKTDWNGNITMYTRDSLGLELTRTEAYGTPQARTIMTE